MSALQLWTKPKKWRKYESRETNLKILILWDIKESGFRGEEERTDYKTYVVIKIGMLLSRIREVKKKGEP